MLAQAEHDVDASAILLTTSRDLADAVAAEVERQLMTLPTAAVARAVHRQQRRDRDRRFDRAGGRDFERACARTSGAARRAICLAQIQNAGVGVLRPVESGGRGRLRVRSQSCSAHLRRGTACAAVFPAADFVKVIAVQELFRERSDA